MNNIFNIQKKWKGETAFIIGGGNSMLSQFKIPKSVIDKVEKGIYPYSAYATFMESLEQENVIGINESYRFAEIVNCTFTIDETFVLRNQRTLPPNMFCAFKAAVLHKGVNQIEISRERYGICTEKNTVFNNVTSGASAINFAYHLGATRIVLIGFDMNLNKGKAHFHNLYGHQTAQGKNFPFAKGLGAFSAIKSDADNLGIEILNTSLKSAIKEFKKVHIKELL